MKTIITIILTFSITVFGFTNSVNAKTDNDTIIFNFNNQIEVIFNTPKNNQEKLKHIHVANMLKDLKHRLDTLGKRTDITIYKDSIDANYLPDSIKPFQSSIQIRLTKNFPYEQDLSVLDKKLEQWAGIIEKRLEEKSRPKPEIAEVKAEKNKESPVKPEPETKKNSPFFFFSFDLGKNNYLENGAFPEENNALYSVKPFGSWFVEFQGLYQIPVAGPLKIQTGGGLSYYNFKFNNDLVRLEETDNGVHFYESTENVAGKKSKLTASYFNLHFVPVLHFGKQKKNDEDEEWNDKYLNDYEGFRIGAGVYGGYRLGSHTKYKYKDDGGNEKDKGHKSFFLNNVRYGGRFQIGYKGFDMFFNYDISPLFHEDKGPELNAFSFGITF